MTSFVSEPLEQRAYFTIPFGAGTSFPAGAEPQGIVVADINGDALADVALTNYSAGTVGVLLGDGQGGLSAPTTYDASPNLSGVAAGDLNGDGKIDLVATGDNLAVLINKGDGTFKDAVTMAAGDTPQNSIIGDVNKNGKADIITANVLGTFASVFLGVGDGTFPSQKKPAAGGQADAALGDVDGDGKLDLVFALFGDPNTHADSGVAVLLGKGDGTFKTAKTFSAGVSPSSIALGDFNSDAKLDIVTANGGLANLGGSNDFSLLINTGGGNFADAVNIPSASLPNDLVVADFNGDSFLDVAAPGSIVNSTRVLLVHEGNGDGTFDAPVTLTIDGGSAGVATGDFNGDGKPDLVNTNTETGSVNLFLNSFASLSKKVLTVIGTDAADTISVTLRNGKIRVRLNGELRSFTATKVQRIEMFSAAGSDLIDFSGISVNTYADAGTGNDVVTGGAGNDTITAGAGKDVITGGPGDDRLNGNGTADKIFGEDGNDRMYGGAGNDLLDGGGGVDRGFGGDGDDVIIGGASNDKLYGEAGNDNLSGGKGADLVDGGAGTDSALNDLLDTQVSIESVL